MLNAAQVRSAISLVTYGTQMLWWDVRSLGRNSQCIDENSESDSVQVENNQQEPDWELIEKMSNLDKPLEGVPEAPDLGPVE